MKKWLTRSFVFVLVSIISLEIVLRILGMATPVLYRLDSNYEYIASPNQNIFRLGRRIITNSYSMRNKELNPKVKKRVLGLGDSVINGGQYISHEDLATTLLQHKLIENLGKKIEVLNISAGSWGPGNVLAYLKKHGNFGAKIVFWIVSSHDLRDNITFLPVVGRLKRYPKKNPLFAIKDIYEKKIIGEKYNVFTEKEFEYSRKYDPYRISEKIEELINYCNKNNIKLISYLHPEKKELEIGTFNEDGLKWKNIFEQKKIEYIDGMQYEKEDGYRDNIHLNKLGQKRLANVIYPKLEKELKKN